MTPQDIITEARYLTNDTDPTGYRATDSELLGYLNNGMREISVLNPMLFNSVGDLTCTAGQCEQAVTFPDAQAISQVLCIHGGSAILPFDIPTMDAFNPNWRADAAGAATQWARMAGDPIRFFIYPKAPALQVIDIMYIRNPTVLGISDVITEIPSGYMPALVDYVVYRSESKDDEHVLSQRAQSHQQSFIAKVKGA